jgi:hypothetical protein
VAGEKRTDQDPEGGRSVTQFYGRKTIIISDVAQTYFTNRRIRNRTYGGVRGRRARALLLLDAAA